MAEVTGLTAERMIAIEDKAIVDSNVVGDDLILTLYDGTTVNAGNVRGPQGDIGLTGDVSVATLNAAIADAVALLTDPDSVTTAMLTDDSVVNVKLADDSVDNRVLANDAVQNANIADDSIDSRHYVDGSIDAVHVSFIKVQASAPAGISGGIWIDT